MDLHPLFLQKHRRPSRGKGRLYGKVVQIYLARSGPVLLCAQQLPLVVLGVVTLPIFIGALFLLVAFVRIWTTELAITNKRIIAKFGLISRSTVELRLEKVESVRIQQSILGRILNYGSVVVAGAGVPQAPIPGISSPLNFRGRLNTVIEEKTAS